MNQNKRDASKTDKPDDAETIGDFIYSLSPKQQREYMRIRKPGTRTIRGKLRERLYFLLFACQFDLTKLFNTFLLCGIGSVSLSQPGYYNTSSVLAQLLPYATQMHWGYVMLIVGLIEFALLFLTGTEPLFAETPKQALAWHVTGCMGFILSTFLYGVLAKLLTPPFGGFGFGTIFFGVAVFGGLYGSLRTGRTIAVDKEQCRLKDLGMMAASSVSGFDIMEKVSR